MGCIFYVFTDSKITSDVRRTFEKVVGHSLMIYKHFLGSSKHSTWSCCASYFIVNVVYFREKILFFVVLYFHMHIFLLFFFQSISSMSDSLSLAPTEVYFSPTSTPRRLSMASSVAMSDQRRASTELWELPEFGDSPLSSPPRTPPPEPTPPPTPPPVMLFM